MITPYNLKAGESVIVNQNGTYGNPYSEYDSSSVIIRVTKKYDKGTKLGTLTGKFTTVKVNGKSIDLVAVLLINPVKPNWTVTYNILWFRATNLDIITENIVIKPKASVVKKATKNAKKRKKKPAVVVNPPVVQKPPTNPEPPYLPEDVPESSSIVPTLVIVGIVCLVGFWVYKKWDYIKLKLTKKKWI